jgi:hypothetical protein
MSTDRELLELAAKAAGYRVHGWVNGRLYVRDIDPLAASRDAFHWAPHEDVGDAGRLAIRLGLSVEPYPYYSTPKHSVIVKQRRRGDQMRETNPTEVVELYGDDPEAAWCLAITGAAAEIGKAQP